MLFTQVTKEKEKIPKLQTTKCSLRITMLRSISNETYANMFSQLVVLKCRLITPLLKGLKMQDCFSGKDLRRPGEIQTLSVCVSACVCSSSCVWVAT